MSWEKGRTVSFQTVVQNACTSSHTQLKTCLYVKHHQKALSVLSYIINLIAWIFSERLGSFCSGSSFGDLQQLPMDWNKEGKNVKMSISCFKMGYLKCLYSIFFIVIFSPILTLTESWSLIWIVSRFKNIRNYDKSLKYPPVKDISMH